MSRSTKMSRRDFLMLSAKAGAVVTVLGAAGLVEGCDLGPEQQALDLLDGISHRQIGTDTVLFVIDATKWEAGSVVAKQRYFEVGTGQALWDLTFRQLTPQGPQPVLTGLITARTNDLLIEFINDEGKPVKTARIDSPCKD